MKACFITIRKLAKVKVYLSQQQLQVLVSSLIFSMLDYCNSVYYGLPAYAIKKLQNVQNCCARLVWKKHIPVNSSLDGIYSDLHWLKIRFRIIYKILLIVHKCLNNKAPEDVSALVSYSQHQRNRKLQETKSNSSYGDRAFSHVGPKLWNLLPKNVCEEDDLVEFKKKLKSFLMTRGEEFVEWAKRR